MCAEMSWWALPFLVLAVVLAFLHLIGKGVLCNKARDDLEHALSQEYLPDVKSILAMRGTYLTKECRDYAIAWVASQERQESDSKRKLGLL
jgi:hypothetical protein